MYTADIYKCVSSLYLTHIHCVIITVSNISRVSVILAKFSNEDLHINRGKHCV